MNNINGLGFPVNGGYDNRSVVEVVLECRECDHLDYQTGELERQTGSVEGLDYMCPECGGDME